MPPRTAAPGARLLPGLDPAIVGIAAFFLAHMLIRLVGPSNFSVDEASIAVFTQVFRFLYVPANPPLFDWLFFGLSRVAGASVVTMQVLKTGLLIGAGIFLYRAARPAFRHRVALHAGIAAYGTTVFYGWDIFQQFSHTVTLIFAMAFTLWAFMRVVRAGKALDYAALGAGLGLGLLSKYMFALYFLALIVAGLRASAYRPALLSPRLLLAIPAALLVAAPLLFGVAQEAGTVFGELGGRVAGSGKGVTLASLGYFLVLTAEFWLPFAAILALAFVRRKADAAAPQGGAAEGGGDPAFYPLLRDASILLVVAVIVSLLALDTNVAEGRYLVGVLSLLPLAVLAAFDRRPDFPALAIERFLRAALGFVIAVAAVRLVFFLFAAPPFCVPRCVVFVDYRPAVEELAFDAGKQTVFVTGEVHIGANLLRLVPNARALVGGHTVGRDIDVAPPAGRACYLVWFATYPGTLQSTLARELRRVLGHAPAPAERALVGAPTLVEAGWETPILNARAPVPTLGVAPIDSAAPLCGGSRDADRLGGRTENRFPLFPTLL